MTKEIPLTQDKVTIVDDDWFEYLNQWKWQYRPHGYAVRTTGSGANKKTICMHREIINPPENLVVDHINKNGLDNRKCNLRICTKRENTRNHKKYCHNTSGYMGVSRNSCRTSYKKWQVRIMVDGKSISLGYYEHLIDAAKAYDEGAKKYWGEFVSLNFII